MALKNRPGCCVGGHARRECCQCLHRAGPRLHMRASAASHGLQPHVHRQWHTIRCRTSGQPLKGSRSVTFSLSLWSLRKMTSCLARLGYLRENREWEGVQGTKMQWSPLLVTVFVCVPGVDIVGGVVPPPAPPPPPPDDNYDYDLPV